MLGKGRTIGALGRMNTASITILPIQPSGITSFKPSGQFSLIFHGPSLNSVDAANLAGEIINASNNLEDAFTKCMALQYTINPTNLRSLLSNEPSREFMFVLIEIYLLIWFNISNISE